MHTQKLGQNILYTIIFQSKYVQSSVHTGNKAIFSVATFY